jgi:hypothetical protein
VERKYLQSASVVWPSIVLVVIGLGLLPSVVKAGQMRPNDKFQVHFAQESLYGWVRVIDQPAKDLRLLTSDPTFRTPIIENLNISKHTFGQAT